MNNIKISNVCHNQRSLEDTKKPTALGLPTLTDFESELCNLNVTRLQDVITVFILFIPGLINPAFPWDLVRTKTQR